jgi:hypothetical protein
LIDRRIEEERERERERERGREGEGGSKGGRSQSWAKKYKLFWQTYINTIEEILCVVLSVSKI